LTGTAAARIYPWQATVLIINADGSRDLVPLVIFRGEPSTKGGSIFKKEKDQYHPGGIVNFKEKAWNNRALPGMDNQRAYTNYEVLDGKYDYPVFRNSVDVFSLGHVQNV
jgi:hypothetical protein